MTNKIDGETSAVSLASAVSLVGIDIGGTKTAVAVVDPTSGRVLADRQIATHAALGAGQLHRRLVSIVDELRLQAGGTVRGVGIGVPELVSPTGLVITDVVVPGLIGDLVSAWADIGVISVESDVRAAAIAESRFGVGASYRSIAYVSVGTGISHTLVVDGSPWLGAHGAAILLGSGVRADPACFDESGRAMTLEEVASGPAMAAGYRAAGGRVDSARDVLDRCEDDQAAAAVAAAAGRSLGLGLAVLVNLLDPEAIVVGGGLGSANGAYWESAVATARGAIWADAARNLPILQSTIGPSAGVVGAALGAHRPS